MNIDGKTSLYGVMGSPISHSLSPLLQNTAFRHMGLNCCYVAFPVEASQIDEAMNSVVCLSIKGVNLTHPLKEVVISCLHAVDSQAEKVGAVNTVVNRDGWLAGHNTDVEGFRWSLEVQAGWHDTEGPVTILGAGGAARAVAVCLAEMGVQRYNIINRTPDRGHNLLHMIQQQSPAAVGEVLPLQREALQYILKEKGLIINTLPHDPQDEEGNYLFSELSLAGETVVFDLRYSPPLPPFLQWAQEKGNKVYNGLGMLTAQAAEAVYIFTEKTPPREIMLTEAQKSQP